MASRIYAFSFQCTTTTEKECVARGLLGGPHPLKRQMTKDNHIKSNTPLLLYNLQRGTVQLGVADGPWDMNIEKDAWVAVTNGRRFPFQVRCSGLQFCGTCGDRDRELLGRLKKGSWIAIDELPQSWNVDAKLRALAPRPASAAPAATARVATAEQTRADEVQRTRHEVAQLTAEIAALSKQPGVNARQNAALSARGSSLMAKARELGIDPNQPYPMGSMKVAAAPPPPAPPSIHAPSAFTGENYARPGWPH